MVFRACQRFRPDPIAASRRRRTAVIRPRLLRQRPRGVLYRYYSLTAESSRLESAPFRAPKAQWHCRLYALNTTHAVHCRITAIRSLSTDQPQCPLTAHVGIRVLGDQAQSPRLKPQKYKAANSLGMRKSDTKEAFHVLGASPMSIFKASRNIRIFSCQLACFETSDLRSSPHVPRCNLAYPVSLPVSGDNFR